MAKNKLIEVKDIHRSFGDKEVLKGITFDINEGERIGIIGKNGAGKSIFLKILFNNLEANSGEIKYNFKDHEKNMGLQFQKINLSVPMDTKEYIEFICKLYANKIDFENLDEVIRTFGLNEFWDTKLKDLSGGQEQRINLFTAVIRNPKFLALDEFITGLDIASVDNILSYIDKIAKEQNKTILIVTHQPEELRNLTERIILIKDGIIAKEFKTSAIEKKYDGNFSKFLLENIKD